MPSRLRRVRELSSFRRIALADWRNPNDPTVYGTLEVDGCFGLICGSETWHRIGR